MDPVNLYILIAVYFIVVMISGSCILMFYTAYSCYENFRCIPSVEYPHTHEIIDTCEEMSYNKVENVV